MNLQQILSDLNDQRTRLDQAIAALEGHAPKRGRPPKNVSSATRPRTMSLAARNRIGEAKRKWWAEKKKANRKKPHVSAAARKRLSEMMKKRWAERKKAAG